LSLKVSDRLNEERVDGEQYPGGVWAEASAISHTEPRLKGCDRAKGTAKGTKAAAERRDREVLPQKPTTIAPSERPSGDPLDAYFRQIGTGDHLSREGEVALAKRIEAARLAMLRALCRIPGLVAVFQHWADMGGTRGAFG